MPLISTATATAALAAGFIATSASQYAASTWQRTRGENAPGRRQAPASDAASSRDRHARLRIALNDRSAGASNLGWQVVEVIETVDESADCRSFYLRDPSGKRLPAFQPGQFIAVRPALGGARQPTRCYSLSDSPAQPWWRITVKLQQPPMPDDVHHSGATGLTSLRRTTAASGLSHWLHQHISVGDSLLVNGPSGTFLSGLERHANRPIVLLAAGIGITPVVSMVKHLLETQPARPMKIYFQAQDQQHWPMGAMLHSWQLHCPGMQMNSYFSRSHTLPTVSAGEAVFGVRRGDRNRNRGRACQCDVCDLRSRCMDRLDVRGTAGAGYKRPTNSLRVLWAAALDHIR